MSKDPFELEEELEELEREMSTEFEGLEPAPMRPEFQEELRQDLLKKLEEKESRGHSPEEVPLSLLSRMKKAFSRNGSGGWKNWKTWKTAVGGAMALALLVAAFWGIGELGMNQKPVQASGITIQAMNGDKLGIEPDTAFLLTSAEPLTEKIVEEALQTSPKFEYTLDKQKGGLEYKIIPKGSLTPNTVYTLAFDPEGLGKENFSWAFQTKAKFHVIRSLPSDKSTQVPIDTGMEITFSHENYDINKIKGYFSISPQVEGTFEKHKKTLVFLSKGLQPTTIYTVTLKKGLALEGTTETLEEDMVFSFETASADQSKPAFHFDMDTSLTEFGTEDQPAFSTYFYREFGSQNATTPPPLQINLYRYPDYGIFQESLAKRDQIPRWSYFTWNRYREKLNSQYKVAEYNTQFLKVNDYSYYILFPEKLEAGYYAAEIKAEDAVRQVWFQVSDLAVYSAQGEESSLFWVNDLRTKAPVSDVQVQIGKKQISAKGNSNGTILVQEDLIGEKPEYALLKSGSKEILVPLQVWPEWYTSNNFKAADYWKYLYLDRELFKPGDTVNFWGVLAPRGKEANQVKEITMELIGNNGFYYENYGNGENPSILSQKLEVKDKTYHGQMKLPVLNPGYYALQVKAGDTVLLSRGFSVEIYEKPTYQLSLTQDKKAVFVGEALNFQAKTTFFEGTPVPGIQLRYYLQDKDQSVATNDQGEAVIFYKGAISEEDYSPYRYVSLYVNAALPETGEISSFVEAYVFKSKVYLAGEAKRQGEGYTLAAKLSRVDLTDLNNGKYLAEENFLKEPVVNSPIKASLYQEVWTQVETGQKYDFISKKVVKTYSYNYSTSRLEDFELITNEKGEVSYTGKLDPKNSYYIDLRAKDQEGREFLKRVHIGGDWANSPDYQYYYLQEKQGMDGYQPGENAEVTFMVNDRELVPAGQNILYYRGQKTIDSYLVSGSSQYSFAFETSYIPNVNVAGVYFDGISYREAYPIAVLYAKDTKALNAKIETDRTEYGPGDKVKLELQVTDKDGKPVKGAQVNLNLVDEALFSLREQNVSFINSLYGDRINLSLLTRKSHNHPEFGGGAESGGEGGSDRKDFRDTVLFATLVTDGKGKASAEFQLPDNLTSWRVTYHAFTQELQAGSGTWKIPVRLPFFADMVINQTYLEGDSPVIILRSYGVKLEENQTVAYKMKLTDARGQEKTWSENGVSFTPLNWKLPALEAGKYSLNVSAASGSLTDSLTKEFQVVKSFQERTVTNQELLTVGMNLKGSPVKPTTVIFSDYEKSQYLQGLYQLAWNNGSRLEQKLAGLEARNLLRQYFPEENAFGESEEQESLMVYQQSDGGISILPYGGSEMPLTAMAAASTSGIFDEKALAGYFYKTLETQDSLEEDRSWNLLGLAALKEPVLLQIQDSLQDKDLAPGVKINLALALLELGDGSYAQKVYRELIGLYGEDLGSVMRIKVGRDQDEMIEATTQMALLAARLDQPEKNKLYQYLLENPGQEVLNLVEQIQILKYNLKYMKASPVSFTYELNDKKITKTLGELEVFKLTLVPEDLKKIKIIQVEGKVGVVSDYSQPIQAGEEGEGEGLKISRTYLVNKVKTNTINRSDLVQVTITYQIGDKAPGGLYEIVDVLPAGLAHISRPYDYRYNRNTNWDYPAEVKGQKLVFQVGKGTYQINYLARVVSPGEFNCEAPLLSNIKNNKIFTSDSQDKVTIK